VELLYDIGLTLALLVGCVVGLLVTAGHYEQRALRHREYEREAAENRELYTALAICRRVKPRPTSDDESSAA
jgi:hypothetical protein